MWEFLKAKKFYSRKGAKLAKKFTGNRRSDFSREFQPMFATKVAPTNNETVQFQTTKDTLTFACFAPLREYIT
jgi:hypothetical protein